MRWGCLWLVACSYSPERVEMIDDAPPVAVIDAPSATPAERCTTKYGSVGQFELCSASESSCTFYVNHGNAATCGEICGPLGGTCVDSHDGECNNLGNAEQCLDSHSDQVCICSL